jgi:hypothetical protein
MHVIPCTGPDDAEWEALALALSAVIGRRGGTTEVTSADPIEGGTLVTQESNWPTLPNAHAEPSSQGAVGNLTVALPSTES